MTSRFPHLDDLATELVAEVLDRPPTLAATRLVCVDGPAGSGKTTLAAALNRGFRDALRRPGSAADRAHVRMVHMDNLYAGWGGLAEGMATVATSLVAPLAAGRAGRYRRWDWHRDTFAEERVVEPADVLLLEGVGAGARAYDDHITALVWVDTSSEVRLARGLARDGEHLHDRWLAWRRQEEEMFAREQTRQRADLVVDASPSPSGT